MLARLLAVLLMVTVGSAVQFVQDAKDDARVTTAQKKLDDASANAVTAFDAAIRKATDEYNKAIDSLVKDAERKGDSADANRLQGLKRLPPLPTAGREMDAQSGPLPAGRQKLTLRLLGTTWKGAGDVEEFRPDGTLYTDEPNKSGWIWVALDATHVLVQYPGGWINVLEFTSDLTSFRLFETCRPTPTESTWRFQK